MEITQKYKLERYDDNVNDMTILDISLHLLRIIEIIAKIDVSYKHFLMYDFNGFVDYTGYVEDKGDFWYITLKRNVMINKKKKKYKLYMTKEEITELYTAYMLIGDKFKIKDYIDIDLGGAF